MISFDVSPNIYWSIAKLSAGERDLPLMVVVGDSISEGYPQHGPLTEADAINKPGQLSYEFELRLKIREALNQGIAGNETADVKGRWQRDVVKFNPNIVFLHIGINDIFKGVALDTMKQNMEFFAASARTVGFKLVVDNIGAFTGDKYTADRATKVTAFNLWLATTFHNAYPEVLLIDYLDWSTGGTGDYLQSGNRLVDQVHPTFQGYIDFAEYASEYIKDVL